jgi:hypothetical protein
MRIRGPITRVALTLVAASPVMLGLALPTASAWPPIKECGDFVQTGFAHGRPAGYWTYRTVHGYTPVANLTTRVVQCSYARSFSLTRHGGRWQGFTCRSRTFYGEDWDVRCTKGNQVIHWQGGA